MRKSTFLIYQSTVDGQYYFQLVSGNGQLVLSSEGYPSQASCVKGIDSVRTYVADESMYKIVNEFRNHHFTLETNNGKIIARSERYKSKSALELGITVVQLIAPKADGVMAPLCYQP